MKVRPAVQGRRETESVGDPVQSAPSWRWSPIYGGILIKIARWGGNTKTRAYVIKRGQHFAVGSSHLDARPIAEIAANFWVADCKLVSRVSESFQM